MPIQNSMSSKKSKKPSIRNHAMHAIITHSCPSYPKSNSKQAEKIGVYIRTGSKTNQLRPKKEEKGALSDYPTKALIRSTLSIAFSNLSKRFLFSISRRSKTATRSSSRARALRSCATISFAWLKSCTVSSSSSELACVSCVSAALRSFCSSFSAFWSSSASSLEGRRVGVRGEGGGGVRVCCNGDGGGGD